MTYCIPIDKVEPGDQLSLATYERWVTVKENRGFNVFKFEAEDDLPFTRWPYQYNPKATHCVIRRKRKDS